MCGCIDLRGGALRIAVTVGIVEKSQLEFRFEHQAARAVDIGQRDTPLFERLLQGSQVTLAHHVHVDTRLDGARRHLFQIAQTVRDHLVDARVVRDDEALEAPLLAQHGGHQPAVGRGGNPVDLVERRHDAAHACLDGRLVGREIFVVHALAAHVGRIVVASRFGSTVESIVLHASHDLVGGKMHRITPLIAVDERPRHSAAEEGIFADALRRTSPAGIARNVDHRGESPADTGGTRLDGRNTGRTLDGLHVPRGRQAERNRKGRLITVDHIHAEDQRNPQTALLDGDALHVADLLHPLDIEQTAHLAAADLLGDVAALGLTRGDVARTGQVELADLLFEGHAAHQRVDILLHRSARRLLDGDGRAAEHDAQQSNECFFHIVISVFYGIIFRFPKNGVSRSRITCGGTRQLPASTVNPSSASPLCTSLSDMNRFHGNPVR